MNHSGSPLPEGLTSASMKVPGAVPSLRQTSRPWVLSSAEKYTTPLRTVSCSGSDRSPPGAISLTCTVPISVPSVFQSSPSDAAKKSVPFTSVSHPGCEPPGPGLMSLTR